MTRKIIHIDMDAFYASIEQRDNPELAGRPVAVGSSSSRGVVMAASYEARPHGVHSAMPSAEARRKCPELTFVEPRMERYKAESSRIRDLMHTYTDQIEPLSLDEAYLDVTEPKTGPPSGTLIARALRRDIREATGLTASAGVSSGKFFAKVASDQDKPDGLTVLPPERLASFAAELPVADFHGVGPATAERLREAGIETGRDLQERSEVELVRLVGKFGHFLKQIASGTDERPVRPDRTRKSIGAERTYGTNLSTTVEVKKRLQPLADTLQTRAGQRGLRGRTVVLKLKYDNFEVVTRQRTLSRGIREAGSIYRAALPLLDQLAPLQRPVRLVGLTLAQLLPPGRGQQLQLPFSDEDGS